MIKKILILSMVLLLAFSGLSGAVMWDLKEIITGKQMVPDDNSGAPWFADNSVMYFGTDKDASLKFNSTAGSLETPGLVMVMTIPIGASEVDQTAFIADGSWQITKIEEVHSVAQNTAYPNTGRVSVMKCTGTQAPGSGSVLHNTTMYLNSTVETVVTPTLNTSTGSLNLADGNRIALDFTGTMTTFAGGCVTIHMKKV